MEIRLLSVLTTLISREVKLIADLNNCFNFDHNIFLMHSSVDIANFVMNGNQPKTLFTFNSSNGNVSGLETLWEVRSKNTLLIVVPECSTFKRNLNLLKQIKGIQRRHKNIKFGLFLRSAISRDDLKNYFLWFRDHFVINGFVVTESHYRNHLKIFTFHTYGHFEVLDVTNRNICKRIFPSLDSNYHRHKFRLESRFTSSLHERFWMSVFRIMNATFKVGKIKHKSNNDADIFPFLSLYTTKSTKFCMYPLLLTHESIIVPEAEPYSGFYSYLQMLTTNTFGYFAGTTVVIVVLLSVCRYVHHQKNMFSHSLVDVLNLLINDNSYITYQRLSRAEVFLIGPLTFVGFVVANGYLSSLQSYFTKPILQPQLRTLHDIYNSPLTITVPPEYVDKFLEWLTYLSPHKDWNNKIIAISNNLISNQIRNFNTSTSYLMPDPQFRMILNVQRRLNIKGFYDTGVKVSNVLSVYQVSMRFKFFEKLNEIIHWTHSSGLLHRWFAESVDNTEKMVLAANLHRLISQQPDDVDKFEFPMFIVYGWIVSSGVLLIEIMLAKVKGGFLSRFCFKNRKSKRSAPF